MNNVTFEQLLEDKQLRIQLAKESHLWFFHIYFSRFVKYETAPFQRELFAITEDESIQNAVIDAFRGSGKSTIMSFSFPVWAILGKPQKKYIVIITQTQQQSRLILNNLREEFETNTLLQADFGPFEKEHAEWSLNSLMLPQFGARIDGFSAGESIRGVRHEQYRPQLVILDDIEDLASIKTKETRDKTYQWFTGDVVPLGDKETKIILIGNLLHEDSLIMRRIKDIQNGQVSGVIKSYPLLDEKRISLWPGKFPTQKEINEEKRKVGSESAWQREYLLRIVVDEEMVVRPEWIQYYDMVPELTGDYNLSAVGVDLAISQEDTANKTAIVASRVFGTRDKLRIYLLTNPLNKRIDFPKQIAYIKSYFDTLGGRSTNTWIYIEQVGYQEALIQKLTSDGYPAKGVKIRGQGKRERLALTTHLIQNGHILFPRHGVEDLITQLTNFGVEKYDDLADAFSLLVIKIMEELGKHPGVVWLPIELPSPQQPKNPFAPNEESQKILDKLKNPKTLTQLNFQADMECVKNDPRRWG